MSIRIKTYKCGNVNTKYILIGSYTIGFRSVKNNNYGNIHINVTYYYYYYKTDYDMVSAQPLSLKRW